MRALCTENWVYSQLNGFLFQIMKKMHDGFVQILRAKIEQGKVFLLIAFMNEMRSQIHLYMYICCCCTCCK